MVDAKVKERIAKLDSRRRREPRGDPAANRLLPLASIFLAIPLTGTIAGQLHGPEAVIAIGVEWTAIAAINVAYALRRSRPRLTAAAADPRPNPPIAPSLRDRLPLAAMVKVEQIRRKADVLLERQESFPPGSNDLYVLLRTKDEYLPSTLDAYLALGGDDRPVTPEGRTALQALRDQLNLLDAKLDEIAEDLQRQNVDRLIANQRFLEEHFGRR